MYGAQRIIPEFRSEDGVCPPDGASSHLSPSLISQHSKFAHTETQLNMLVKFTPSQKGGSDMVLFALRIKVQRAQETVSSDKPHNFH